MTLKIDPRWFAVACAVLLLLSANPAAIGQDALSSGNALDNRRITGGQGNQRVNSSLLDYRARNLIVTGNVAGGRGFRESVGYAAARDFRGETGSDDLFGFRAFSALSNPLSVGSRDLGRSLGASMGLIEYSRTAAGATSGLIARDRASQADRSVIFDTQLRIDRASAQMPDELDRRGTASPIGIVRGSDRSFMIESIPLRGVSAEDAATLELVTGLPVYDRLRVLEDLETGALDAGELRAPFQTRFSTDAGDSNPAASDLRVESLDRTGYETMLNRVRSRVDEAFDLDATYQQLRDRLAERTREPRSAPEGPQDEKPTLDPDRPRQIDTGVPDPLQSNPDRDRRRDQDLDEDDDPRMQAMTEADRERIRQLTEALLAGGTIESFSARDEDRFNELMQRAEQALRDDEYFFAERRFTRALQLKPGHPLASAGLGHAQIGAGMLLSAALTIEKLLREHPEMIAADYADGLFPDAERMSVVINMINRRMEVEADPQPYALLLAYIGRQMADRSLVQRGLGWLNEAATSDEALADDPLLDLLNQAWLEKGDGSSSENDAADG